MNGAALIVANPVSGAGRAKRLRDRLCGEPALLSAVLNGAGLKGFESRELSVLETDREGEWKQKLSQHLRAGSLGLVIGIGGDGTLGEIVSSLHQNGAGQKVGLFAVPGGRGNDFVRALYRFSGSEDEFVDWLGQKGQRWRLQATDLGSANGKLFLNMASLGYGGEVVRKSVSRKALWSSTRMVYKVEGVLAILEGRECGARIEADGKPAYEGPFFGAFIGNGRANGDGLFWTPQASLDDGALDLIAFRKPGLTQMAKSLGRVQKGKDPAVTHVRLAGGVLRLHFDRAMALELDGEYSGEAQEFEFRALPGAVRLWVPGVCR